MNYCGIIRYWVVFQSLLFWGDVSLARPGVDISKCDFSGIGGSLVEAKIANGIEEPITLQIPEKYLGLDKEDVFDETKKQVRIIVDPKTLHPFQKSVRPPNDRSFKLYREDLKRRVDITITGIFFGQKSQQLMNKLVQQFIDLPDKITQLIPEENGLHRLEGDTPMPSSDI